ncbi:hypothetical protein S40285_09499 [Stachybotrys chlorohalonatus IBT 40285]|uniref:Uncharacterized protein n=1 Tax=Stachybotrys chlorohalonatus (strain IBT 40285) TaxID=1283841 RepID=A0A084QNT2_STAC4|nr:hypothetical protein S40285_09499 [Stachybotrys chlorohalonata IBT 40285]
MVVPHASAVVPGHANTESITIHNDREHAAKVSRYLQTALTFIDTTNGQLREPQAVRAALMSALKFLAKLAKTPDVGHIHDAIQAAHAETKQLQKTPHAQLEISKPS